MPKRSDQTTNQLLAKPNHPLILAGLCLLLLVIGTTGLQASTVVRIYDVGPIQPGDTIIVPVMLDSVTAGLDIVGFDFLIAWERTAFRLIEAQEGQLLTDCGWEYFNTRDDVMTDWNGLPVNIPLVRVVSVADLNNGDIHPSCNATAPGELVRLVFEASSHPMSYGSQAPIQFLWNDCGDNAMALTDGTLLVSDQVFEYGLDWSEDSEFPTWFGAPDVCLTGGPDTLDPIREIDFYNGVMQFAVSDTSSNADAAVCIAGDQVAWLGWPTVAEIRVENLRSPWEASGFDLLIQYDNTGLTFTSAQLGHNLSVWNWEYFDYMDDPAQGLVRLVAVADLNNGDIHPSNLIYQDGEIAMLHFEVINNPANIGRELPLKFLWNDCGDNAFASAPNGDSLYVSKDVYDKYGFVITAEDTMPTIHGVPQGCVSASTVRRSVDYFSNFIQAATEDPSEAFERGDINLNNVPNEIADLVLFSNYFFYGLAVFNVNVEAQVAATDVNADGIVLTLDDFIYLHRVIIGDVDPFWDKSPATDTAYIVQDTTAKSLTLVYSDSLAILYMTFNGVIDTVQFESETHDVGYLSDASSTRMMVAPRLSESVIHSLESGFLLSYTGDVQIVTAEAAYDGINPIPAIAQIGQGEQCCIDRGNINHDPEGLLDISDLVYFVSFMFGLGPLPPCPGEADINANGIVEIGDLVWLVDYMFNSGPAPVPCP